MYNNHSVLNVQLQLEWIREHSKQQGLTVNERSHLHVQYIIVTVGALNSHIHLSAFSIRF